MSRLGERLYCRTPIAGADTRIDTRVDTGVGAAGIVARHGPERSGH
jgi:hypothetical protein